MLKTMYKHVTVYDLYCKTVSLLPQDKIDIKLYLSLLFLQLYFQYNYSIYNNLYKKLVLTNLNL